MINNQKNLFFIRNYKIKNRNFKNRSVLLFAVAKPSITLK